MVVKLFYHIVGRPIRKVLFLSIQLLEVLLRTANRAFHFYGKVLTILHDGTDTKLFRTTAYDELQAYYRDVTIRVQGMPNQPKISIILPVYRVDPAIFRETLASVAMQCYTNWELCIVDDASGISELQRMVHDFAAVYPGKVKFATNSTNVHISATSNRGIEMATGEYLALLDHDDRLTPNALAEMVRYINLNAQSDIFYSDERVIESDGKATFLVYCKPDWSPFLHLSCNYTTHLSLYRTTLIREIGGFRTGFEGSQDHDLMMRGVEATDRPIIHVPFCLYQWRAVETSTAKSADSKPYAAIAGVKAVTEACQRRGRPADVQWEPESFHYRVRFELPTELPLVSILIPTKDHGESLRKCLESIFASSTYPNFEVVLLDNATTQTAALDVMRQFQSSHPKQLRIEHVEGPFNFASLNNRGASIAQGEYLVLLNNDTIVQSPDWIEEMLRLAQFPEVGAVGCKLLYPTGKIQHAGLELQDRRVANHSFKELPENTTAYNNITKTVHEVSAITGACLMIAQEKYHEVGGLDEVFLPNGYGDVDFCLRLSQRGYEHLYTPYATLIHEESRSRGRVTETFERHYMISKWGHQLMNDPYVNLNLNRDMSFSIDSEFPFIDPTGKDFQDLLRAHEAGQLRETQTLNRAA
ncbi:putative glycosyltransferase EpsE [Symmachiella macrocystis]|uniref:Putative glycosyltransferase EpsE n=1 Tax=Symmachiella macrocystis TaxID=2527985 RepID=A0A5C6BBM8_9PLAN|nr:glycosyltransferase family 2 protein [Symmachiella macrocystis]TWU09635.1 putative glycosyltransferase EpsE [Symmachiella macrocystis]